MICHLLYVQEVIAHLWAMRDERLLEFERKEVSFNKVKACIEDVSDIIMMMHELCSFTVHC